MHLIVDHSSNQDNVRLLTEVGEQDLLNMIESEDKNTVKVEEPKKEEVKKEELTVVPVKEKKWDRFISICCTCNLRSYWSRILFKSCQS